MLWWGEPGPFAKIFLTVIHAGGAKTIAPSADERLSNDNQAEVRDEATADNANHPSDGYHGVLRWFELHMLPYC